MPTASGSLAFLGAARFQGYWNAGTNNATGSGLTGGVTGPVAGLFLTGTSTSNGGYSLATGLTASAGDYWQVTGSGTHNVDGTTSWNLNDFCIYSGSAGGTGDWIKLAFEDTIASIVLGDLSSGSFHLGAANNKHIIFASGSVHSGSNDFIFDYTNNRVGIGTTSPETLAHIQNGSAGTIATTDGALLTLESNEKPKIHFQSPGAYGGAIVFGSPTDNDEGQIDYDHGSDRFLFKTGGNTKMAILGDNVGIGTTAPLDTLSVTGTLAVSAATSFRDDVNIADDKKVIFGTNSDAHIEYNENGDDNLIISGSSSGMVLSGTMVQVSGNMVVKFPNYLAVTSNDSHNASSFYVQTGQGAQFHGGVDNAGVTIRDAGDVHIADDKKIIFGTNEDSHIEYNENGDDFLIISGSHGGGTVISGSKLAFDSSTVASGTIAGPGSYLAVKSTGQVVLTSSAGGGAISTVANGANNRVATFGSADSLNGEIGLQFDGSTLDVAGDISLPDDKKLIFGTNSDASFEYDEDGTDTLLYAGASIRIPDDTKLEFGSAGDGHIEYNENGDDFLVISGSAKGIALSGTNVAIDGRLIGAGDEDTYIDLSLTANDQINLVAGGNYYATFLNGTPKIINFNALQEDIDFKINQDAGLALHMSGSDGILHSHYGIVVHDDKKVIFGGNSDGHIEYNENGDDFLIVSGSSKGVALSGSVIALDGNTNVAGTFIADAGISGTHQLTGSLQITGSDGVSLQLKSTGSVSIRLEADSDNNNEAQNPFIEFVQDGTAVDYTMGLNTIGKSPDGLAISKGADNTLMLGANQAPTSTSPGHIQFYTRQTASFSLLDKGSTNFGGTVDREGFRVGIGPSFNTENFPKGRVEIHNTADAPVPALYLAVSGTTQPALITEAANTTRNIVEITGSSLTTGDMMVLYSDSSNTSDRTLLNITNDNASSEKVVLVQLTQDAFSYPAFIQRGGGTVKNLPTFNTSNTAGQTIAITHLIEGSYFAVGRNAGQTDTTPTSAQIVARIKDAAVGDSFQFAYFNLSSNTVTLAGGTNVKMLNTAAASFDITAGKGRMFAFVVMNVGSGTEQVNMIPQSDLFDLNS